jgi:hypothetical protein
MEPTNQKPKDAESAPDTDTTPVAPYNLLYITRAYNRKEITFEQWLSQSREWAERMIRQYGKAK